MAAAALLEEFLLRLLNTVAGSAECNLLTSIYNGERERAAAFYTVQHHITSKGTLSIFVIKKVSPPRTRRRRVLHVYILHTRWRPILACTRVPSTAENPFSPSLSVANIGTLHLFSSSDRVHASWPPHRRRARKNNNNNNNKKKSLINTYW